MATAAALVASLRSQSALETLLKVVSNILKAPTEPKYRTLKTSNAKISVITEASVPHWGISFVDPANGTEKIVSCCWPP